MNLALATTAFTARPAIDWLRALGQVIVPTPMLDTRERQLLRAIDKSAVVEIVHPYGATIDCLTGSVWVTLDNDQRVIVQALEAARVRINELV